MMFVCCVCSWRVFGVDWLVLVVVYFLLVFVG